MPSLVRKLDRLYASSPALSFDSCSRIVLMSDCHRGQGNGGDNFLPTSPIFQGALEYYYHNGFTYIELGAGDELGEGNPPRPSSAGGGFGWDWAPLPGLYPGSGAVPGGRV